MKLLFKGDEMRFEKYLQVAFGVICFACIGCQNPDEKLRSEKVDAAVNISKAEQEVAKTRATAEKRIEKAQGFDVEKAKIQATKDIREAKREVEDEKVEATENIVDAEQKAKTDRSPELP